MNKKSTLRKVAKYYLTHTKENKAITLIALVVTIVVLLILAGVSINLVVGNNGIISKALEAKNATLADQENTQIAMNSLYNEIEAVLGGTTGGGSNEGDEGGNTTNDLKIGDYVNYTYDAVARGYSLTAAVSGYDTDQTISQPVTALKWRVLSINNDGSVDLVSETPTDQDVYFKGSLGYNNGVYTLNDMCAKLFSNTNLGITARSIALEDIESKMNSAGITTRNENNNGNKTYGETQTYTSSSYRYYPNLYASQIGAGINTTEVTQPDITEVNPYKESSNGYTSPTNETYSQADANGLTVTQTYYYMSSLSTYFDDSTFYSMIFETGTGGFWEASRFSNCGSTGAYFGLRCLNGAYLSGGFLFYSGDGTNSYGHRLRPVVSMSSDIVNGLTKGSDGTWQIDG